MDAAMPVPYANPSDPTWEVIAQREESNAKIADRIASKATSSSVASDARAIAAASRTLAEAALTL